MLASKYKLLSFVRKFIQPKTLVQYSPGPQFTVACGFISYKADDGQIQCRQTYTGITDPSVIPPNMLAADIFCLKVKTGQDLSKKSNANDMVKRICDAVAYGNLKNFSNVPDGFNTNKLYEPVVVFKRIMIEFIPDNMDCSGQSEFVVVGDLRSDYVYDDSRTIQMRQYTMQNLPEFYLRCEIEKQSHQVRNIGSSRDIFSFLNKNDILQNISPNVISRTRFDLSDFAQMLMTGKQFNEHFPEIKIEITDSVNRKFREGLNCYRDIQIDLLNQKLSSNKCSIYDTKIPSDAIVQLYPRAITVDKVQLDRRRSHFSNNEFLFII